VMIAGTNLRKGRLLFALATLLHQNLKCFCPPSTRTNALSFFPGQDTHSARLYLRSSSQATNVRGERKSRRIQNHCLFGATWICARDTNLKNTVDKRFL
jgi:hypothetical protein